MADLNKLHPYVKHLAEMLIEICKKNGVDIIITQTLRTAAEQNALYAQGRTKPGRIVTNAKGGDSYHNYGLAFDIAVRNKDKTINWSDICDTDHDGKKDYNEVGYAGMSIGLEWGGKFKSIIDIPHFQWTGGLTLKDLKAGKRPKNPLEKGGK